MIEQLVCFVKLLNSDSVTLFMVTKRHFNHKKEGEGSKREGEKNQMTVPEDNLTQVKLSFCFQQNDNVHTPIQG